MTTKLRDCLTKKQTEMIETNDIKFSVPQTGLYVAIDNLKRQGEGRTPRLALEALLASV